MSTREKKIDIFDLASIDKQVNLDRKIIRLSKLSILLVWALKK